MKPAVQQRAGPGHRWRHGLCSFFVLAALVLSACGGAPDTSLVNSPDPGASSPVTPGPSATVLGGLYRGYLDSDLNHEFLALVVPGTGLNVKVYGWYYGAGDAHLAHLYTGDLVRGTQGAATSVLQSWKVREGDFYYPASATVSSGSLSHLTAALSVSRNSVGNYSLAADALLTAAYNPSATPMDLRNSQWNGYWSSKSNTISGTLAFGADGTPDVSDTGWNCFSSTVAPPADPHLSWQWTAQASNFFKVTLSVPSITGCTDWEHHSFTGVAVVSQSGSAYQLDMMLLDDSGNFGISYRGTRP